MPRVLRRRARVSYMELEEPSFDEYLFCSSCGDYVYEYCAIHGPLLVIPDNEVPTPTGFPPFVPRAALTIPSIFLHLAPSTIPGAGIGVFTTLTLPRGVRFGPYRGMKTDDASSPYCWQLFDRSHKPAHAVDARDPNRSNWMRYVNCSRHASEQNLVAYQYYGQLYYRTVKIIPRFTELLVFYGSESACELHIDVARYNAPAYTEVLVKRDADPKEQQKLSRIKDEPISDAVDTKENIIQYPKLHENTPDQYKRLNHKSEPESSKECSINNLENIKPERSYENAMQNIYICDYCDQTFNEKDNIITHIANHNTVKDVNTNSNKTFQKPSCTICGCKFSIKSDLINHLVSVHDSKMEFKACPQCNYKTVKNKHLQDHIRRHSAIRKYKCNRCEYVAKTYTHLSNHQKLHSTDYSCTTCGSKFMNKRILTMHLMVHTEDRPHACTICGLAFKKHKDLKKHSIVHATRDRSFKCLTCAKCFYTGHCLKRHERLHS